ncbi:hypothetical protein AVEN_168432-1 [Araneus ventricosus]|uniref:Uncharacterized protein n=1 Tax=Araneus ventricosus TaxID=182803 RepID=A0A4Y2JDQ0_ARAVE|nr:hypothetical protein AVEN_168432-1 [Araneus ventricosus]
MRAKQKSVSEIAATLGRSKRVIYQILVKTSNENLFLGGHGQLAPATTCASESFNWELFFFSNYSEKNYPSPNIIGGQISNKTIHRRILESGHMENRKMT